MDKKLANGATGLRVGGRKGQIRQSSEMVCDVRWMAMALRRRLFLVSLFKCCIVGSLQVSWMGEYAEIYLLLHTEAK